MPAETPIAAQRKRAALLFVAPMVAALAAVAGWPLGRTIYFAFTDATLASIDAPRWIGLDNFVFLQRDPVWWQAVQNTLIFAFASVCMETSLGLLIALLLNAELRARGLLRAAVLDRNGAHSSQTHIDPSTSIRNPSFGLTPLR
jgi:trehalose/maltose transport system permease protein